MVDFISGPRAYVWDESMPVELSGAGLHGDYIGRRDGWEWPNDGDLAEA
jgi:hypothetical protein